MFRDKRIYCQIPDELKKKRSHSRDYKKFQLKNNENVTKSTSDLHSKSSWEENIH